MRIKLSGSNPAVSIVTRVEPKYPDEAKRQHVEGQVILHAIIGVDGAVKEVTVISGPRELGPSALEAVKQWRYKQTLINGQPIEVDTTIAVDFRLGSAAEKPTSSVGDPAPPSGIHDANGSNAEPLPCSNPSKSYTEARCLEDLANVYEAQRNYADAQNALRRALEVQERALGPDQPEVAWAAQRLAYSYMQDGKYADAEPYLKRAITIREEALGPDSRDVSQSLLLLANAYYAQRKYTDAEPLYVRALAIREKVLPQGNPGYADVAETMDALGVLYISEGKLAQAEPLFGHALEIRETAFRPDHPFVIQSLDHLASVYTLQAKYAEAEPLFKRALANIQPHPESSGSLGAVILEDYAGLLRRMNRQTEAEKMEADAKAIRGKATR